eukprot:scaffold34872_cov144-Skeletonema_dohrnii-CCMP3373.AAC.1
MNVQAQGQTQQSVQQGRRPVIQHPNVQAPERRPTHFPNVQVQAPGLLSLLQRRLEGAVTDGRDVRQLHHVPALFM